MKFGSTEQTKIIDEHGSTVMTETKYRSGTMTAPIRMRYNVQVKILDQKQEFEEYARFSDELKQNTNWFDPCWQWKKHSTGDFIIKSYTTLEY